MRRLWVLVAGVGGIVLAVLLIPRPDTGEVVSGKPVAMPTSGRAADLPKAEPRAPRAKDADNGSAIARPGTNPVAGPAGQRMVDGPNPLAAALAKKRNTPESLAAARVSAPWTQVRRVLMGKSGDEQAADLAKEADSIVRDLRELRRSPEDWDFAELEGRMAQVSKDIRASEHTDDEVERMLSLVEDRLKDYHEAAAAEE